MMDGIEKVLKWPQLGDGGNITRDIWEQAYHAIREPMWGQVDVAREDVRSEGVITADRRVRRSV